MNSDLSTADLYRLLVSLGIPVLYENGEARPQSDIINDMCRAWNNAHDPPVRRQITEMLEWMAVGGGFSPPQLLLLNIIKEETDTEEEKDCNPALDEFLSGFTVVGGDSA